MTFIRVTHTLLLSGMSSGFRFFLIAEPSQPVLNLVTEEEINFNRSVAFSAFVHDYSGGSASEFNGVPFYAEKHLNGYSNILY